MKKKFGSIIIKKTDPNRLYKLVGGSIGGKQYIENMLTDGISFNSDLRLMTKCGIDTELNQLVIVDAANLKIFEIKSASYTIIQSRLDNKKDKTVLYTKIKDKAKLEELLNIAEKEVIGISNIYQPKIYKKTLN